MNLLWILVILILLGALPIGGDGRGWHGYGLAPFGGLGFIVLVIVLVLLLRR